MEQDEKIRSVDHCKTCGWPIVWLRSAGSSKWQIVNAETVKGTDGMFFDAKKGHIDHHATCPQAEEWKKKKAPLIDKPQRMKNAVLKSMDQELAPPLEFKKMLNVYGFPDTSESRKAEIYLWIYSHYTAAYELAKGKK